MRILVTGGAGYIGSHVIHELNKRDLDIVVVDDLKNGSIENINPRNEFIHGRLQDEDTLEKIFSRQVDAVFHFAALKAAGESMHEPEKYMINNINGTLTLLARMHVANCKYFIFSSSAAVYGDPTYLPLDENHPLSPTNYYGYTKLCIEENLSWMDKLRGLKYAALRYFNAAGYDVDGNITGIEKDTANLLPIIMEVATGTQEKYFIFGDDYDTPDGTCIRDYIHVSDLARAHILSMDYIMKENKSLVVNLGSETGHTVKEMAILADQITGKKIPHEIKERRSGDSKSLYASSAKAKELLNWKPEYSSPETIVKSMWHVYNKQI